MPERSVADIEDASAATLTGADVFRLVEAEDARISPDGREIAYVRLTPDVRTDRIEKTVWLVDTISDVARPFAERGSHDPIWSPRSDGLAYLAADDAGNTQLFVKRLDVRSGVKHQVTHGALPPQNASWAPDGRLLAFTRFVPDASPGLDLRLLHEPADASWAKPPVVITSTEYQRDGSGLVPRGRTRLFVTSADTAREREIATDSLDVVGRGSWSADASALVFSARQRPSGSRLPWLSEIYESVLGSGRVRQLTRRGGSTANVAFSPDGRSIAFTAFGRTSSDYTESHVFLMRPDGTGGRRVDGSLDREVSELRWGGFPSALYIAYGDRGRATFARLRTNGGVLVISRAGATEDFSVSDDGRLAITTASNTEPASLALVTGKTTRLMTRLNSWLSSKTLARTTYLRVRSSFDGRLIDAWVTLPPRRTNTQRTPTILWIHGGPHGYVGPTWRTDFQLMAAAGYAVVDANPRGSTSYGATFAHLPHLGLNHDVDDLMSVVDAAVARGLAHEGRLYVAGTSYGGQMTTWIVGKTNRFSAAVAEKPAVDIVSDALGNDQYLGLRTDVDRTLPWTAPSRWWNASSLSLVGHVRTPTMLVVGEMDVRTPPIQSELFYDALRLEDVPTALVLFPGASHSTLGARPSQYVAVVNAALAWFDRYRAIDHR